MKETKNPTKTFIGGLIIGLTIGGLIGATLEARHLLPLIQDIATSSKTTACATLNTNDMEAVQNCINDN